MDSGSLPNPASPGNPQAQTAAGGAIAAPQAGWRELVLVKNKQRHVFRCQVGGEVAMIDHLRSLAQDPASGITWLDAVALSRQLNESLQETLRQLILSDQTNKTPTPNPKVRKE